MKIPEKAIEAVVIAASSQMDDATYVSGRVDELIALQPAVMQYIVAHKDDFSVEAIVQVLFHASLIHESVASGLGRSPATVDFADLDRAANKAPDLETFAEQEANLASYIYSNVVADSDTEADKLAGTLLTHVARALVPD